MEIGKRFYMPMYDENWVFDGESRDNENEVRMYFFTVLGSGAKIGSYNADSFDKYIKNR